MNETPPFPRTVCGCLQCVKCCERPAHLAPYDVPRLMDYFGADAFAKLFKWSKGATVGRIVDDALVTWQVPTITPRTENGWCVFMKSGLCTIHEIAPFGCAYFDVHMNEQNGQMRSAWGIRQIIDSPMYAEVRDSLEGK
jgi:Fe-S-cluster containining protein